MLTARIRRSVLLGALLLTAGCGGDGAEVVESPTAEAPSPETPSVDLSQVLLQPDEALEGVTMDSGVSGPVDVQDLGAEIAQPGEEWPPRGIVGAFRHVFLMPAPEDPEAFPAEDVRGLVSLGIQFEDAETAGAFLGRGFPPDAELDHPDWEMLGEERLGLRTPASADRPVRTTLIWRRGFLYFQLNVFGDYPLDEAMRLALSIDGRAAEEPS